MSYQPPLKLTSKIVDLASKISENIGLLTAYSEQSENLYLRRVNRIRTIQGSLAIEGNTLSEAQVTAVLDGKHVIAPPREIQEVKNALKAYDMMDLWNPLSEKHLLKAHHILMAGLMDESGRYRSGGVGVIKGTEVVHVAPPAKRIPLLMADLLQWLKTSEHHPLITSAVFHYEFEFIHPFADGNGRMGRLWQSLILQNWKLIFKDIPVESLVHQYQAAYYVAIQHSTEQTDAAPFVSFMLERILDAMLIRTPQVTPHVTPQVKQLFEILKGEMGRDEIQQALGLRDRKSFRERYLKPALEQGFIEMTIPDKPHSRLQKYRIKG